MGHGGGDLKFCTKDKSKSQQSRKLKNWGQTEPAGINNDNIGRHVDVRVFYDVLYNKRQNVNLLSSAALGEKNINT